MVVASATLLWRKTSNRAALWRWWRTACYSACSPRHLLFVEVPPSRVMKSNPYTDGILEKLIGAGILEQTS